jgi:hypothetical protein
MVRFDEQAAVGFRSNVNGVGEGSWDSDDPGDKVVPANDWLTPTTWDSTQGNAHTYAHEFGHIIGLSDTYEDRLTLHGWVSEPIPGAPVDVMSGGDLGNVEQATIDRLVKRSGVVTDAMIKCDYKVDTQVDWYHYFGIKCGSPEGAWRIDVDGEYPFGGGKLVASGRVRVTLDPANGSGVVPLQGTWGGYYRVDVEGVPVSTGGQEGTIGGKAGFDQPTPMQLVLTPTHSQGSYWSQNPYGSLSGAAQDRGKVLTLPVVNGSFCRDAT